MCRREILLLLTLLLVNFNNLPAQVCSGSRGDAILKIDFGTTRFPDSGLSQISKRYNYVRHDCPNDRSYTITNKTPSCWSEAWFTVDKDHTNDPHGCFLLLNSSHQPGEIFLDTVKGLCANTTYEFATWIMNLNTTKSCDGNTLLPNMTFTVEKKNGTILNQYETGDLLKTPGPEWKQYGLCFSTSNDVTEVVVRITNNNPGGCGNDLAIDDITLRPCGPDLNIYFTDNSSKIKQLIEGHPADVYLKSEIKAEDHLNIQWQESINNGVTWVDIPNEKSIFFSKHFSASAKSRAYKYRLTASAGPTISPAKCRFASEPVTVNVNKRVAKISLPNAFSPNGDGINDTWNLAALNGYTNSRLTIYTRGGQPVYEIKGNARAWDGRYNGNLVPPGTYYYVIDPGSGEPSLTGTVVIVK